VAGGYRHRIGDISPSILMVGQCYWPHRSYAMDLKVKRFRRMNNATPA